MSRAGRHAYDYVLLFKILVIQKLYNLSDEQTEYQILDRTSFRNFLGICCKVPDSTTIWLFRDNLVNAGIMDKLFGIFHKQLEDKGLVSHEGCIIDASFVEVPRQRNSREENAQIKEGKMPENWDSKRKISQKDTDARWTKKRNVVHYGYEDHIKVDKESKIIMNDALKIRSIGIKKAEFSVGLTNLVYNILRYKFLQLQG